MKVLHTVAFILVIIGALNWGLSAFDFNVIDKVFGLGSAIAKVIYVLVGLSAVYLVFEHKNTCRHCETKPAQPAM